MTKWILLLPLVAALLTGCETTPKQSAYKTLKAVGEAVSTATDLACDARNMGKIDDKEWAAIDAMYTKYLRVYTTACRMAGYDYSKYADAELIQLYNEILLTIDFALK